MRFPLTILTVLLAAIVLFSAAPRIVQSDVAVTGTTDQANVAAGTDATYVPGSADLEGVSANDQTTYTFRIDVNPAAAGGPPGISATGTTSASSERPPPSETNAVVTDAGDGGGGGLVACATPSPTPAPTGFDDKTNGLIPQGTPPPDCTEPVPGTFEGDKAIFEEVDVINDGLGPVYNAQSCKECHQNPVTGAISQINELRAGHNIVSHGVTTFVDAPGGSLINDRGIPTPNYDGSTYKSAKVQERVPPLYTAAIISGPAIIAEEPVRTFRASLNTLGDGFVEAVADGTLVAIANNQPGTTGNEVHGLPISVPVLEANFPSNPDCANPNVRCVKRIGRFGWKNQHASLLSFSADAYLNEIGITNFLIRKENTSLNRFVGFGTIFDIKDDNAPCDAPNQNVLCGEDNAQDVKVFAEFMRATKAPPQDPDIKVQFQTDVQQGGQLFAAMFDKDGFLQYSCSVCHVPSIVTAPPCTPINGGMFSVPLALGSKIIRPFSDFLLHDVGTGDFIVQNGGPITRTKVRTPPLWGVRTRTRLMHDGDTKTFNEAILRHGGEAAAVVARYQLLNTLQKRQLITFLESL
jgi:CxxC motif-containing protein (DUF1111 family)